MLSWSNYVNHKNAVKISLMELNLKTRQLMVLIFFFFSHWELWQSISTFRAFPTVGKTNVSPKRLRLREILLESARCAGIRGWNRNSHLNSNSATDRAFFHFCWNLSRGVLFQFFKIFLSCHVGSIAEEIKGSEKMKNTSAVFNPKGKLIGKYTKVSNWGTS